MSAREERFIAGLQTIRDAGASIRPRWDAANAHGFVLDGASGAIEEIDPVDLDWLADRGYLERIFFDRLARCPDCRSRHLNFREVCVSCRSSNLGSVELLHHFRCGYVAPVAEFFIDADVRRCPKCHGRVRDRGTDHDVPGPNFSCNDCGIAFQMPDLGAVCLQCGHRIDGDKLQAIVYEDIVGYRLTALADAALRNGRLFGDDEASRLMEPHMPVYRRLIFMEFIEDERRRFRRFGTPFSLLLITAGASHNGSAKTGASGDVQVAERIRELLEETDKIGLYNDGHFVALLPGTNERQARRMAKRIMEDDSEAIRSNHVQATVVALSEGVRTAESLARYVRAVEQHA